MYFGHIWPLPSKTISQLVQTLMFICMQKINSIPNFLVRNILQICYFEYFENARSCPAVIIVSPCRKLWCPNCWNQVVGNFGVYLHCKKSTSSLSSFLRCCKHIANCYFVILGNLGMPCHTPLKWQYQFEGTFDVYLQSKNQLILHAFLKIGCQYFGL